MTNQADAPRGRGVPTGGADTPSVHEVELLISNLLRIGVATSLVVVVLGTVLSFVHHPDYLTSPEELERLTRPGAAFPRTLGEVIAGLSGLQGRAVTVVGLLMLVATPVLRVAVSILAFIHQRDRTFVLITTTVLVLLLLAFALGKVEG
ncbi:DUF1634 domain-containing protein [Sorangium sp. So ce302]|uniref:DUF1634 domain-containing protein n=1 Tax=Sorangium sp. So ce302 TaxID=3133297 RepID=UPI003F63CF52